MRPQLGENIGFSARAMWTCGLDRLRLVAPRDGWPSEVARAAAAGAAFVAERAEVFADVPAAIGDLQRVYAATARPRDMVKPVLTPREAAASMRADVARGLRVGLMFGPERSGLDNDDAGRADAIVTVPLNPAFTSLQLGHAVMVIAYEWFVAGDPPASANTRDSTPAPRAELEGLYGHLEAELAQTSFFPVAEKRPIMMRNIRNVFARAGLTRQEVSTLRGVIAQLARRGRQREGGEG